MKTKTIVHKSAAPIYAAAATWLLYALLFPLYAVGHFLLAAAASAVVALIARMFCRDVTETVEIPEEPVSTGNVELDKMIAEGDAAVKTMRMLNDSIQDEKISAQIDRLEAVSTKIFDYVKDHPEKLPQIRKFMSYYLPTTLKLLRSYDELSRQGVSGQNITAQIDRLEAVSTKIFDYVKDHPEKLPQIRKFMSYYLPTTLKLLRSYDELSRQGVSGQNITGTMEKVEGMMDTIVLAFEKQLDGLFGDQAMDISTDITVLDNMMAREGLTGGDALHKAAQENPVSDPEPELDIRSDSGEADGGITLQL